MTFQASDLMALILLFVITQGGIKPGTEQHYAGA